LPEPGSELKNNTVDRRRLDADQDPDPTFHFDANQDLDPGKDLDPIQVFYTAEKSFYKIFFKSQQSGSASPGCRSRSGSGKIMPNPTEQQGNRR
jgi:hypothetical protein